MNNTTKTTVINNNQDSIVTVAPYGVLVKALREHYVWEPEAEGAEYDEEGFDSSFAHRSGWDIGGRGYDDQGYDYFGVNAEGYMRDDRHWLVWNYKFANPEEEQVIRKMLPEVLDDFTMETVLEAIGYED